MKIYIVEASYGSYESDRWIHSVHIKRNLAEESRDKINSEWEAKKNSLPPFPVDEYGDLVEDGLSKEEIKEFDKWWFKNYEANEWNGAKVLEYEIEKVYERMWAFEEE